MEYVEQIIWDKEEAPAKLKAMDLDADKLIRVAAVAVGQANNVTRYFATNAWGALAYHFGIAELRSQFVGPVWSIDRSEGIESMVNEPKNLKVIYQNVDVAMGKSDPKPRSPKGAGSERACEGNQLGLLDDLPVFLPKPTEPYQLWALMVDDAGNLELSRPIVKGGTFSVCIERIRIADADDWRGPDPTSADDDVADDFDVKVAFKK